MPNLRPSRKTTPSTAITVSPTQPLTDIALATIVRPETMDIRRLIDEAVAEEDWLAIIRSARDLAKSGDNKSREFLARYRFGTPAAIESGDVDKSRAGALIVEVEKSRDTDRDDR